MSQFECLVYEIKEPVIDHPDADRLSLIQIEGYTCISAKLEDGSHRYKQGDLVVYIPEGAVLPEWMMKSMEFWDENKNKPAFKYVKAKKLRGIFSQGILYSLSRCDIGVSPIWGLHIKDHSLPVTYVDEGENVAKDLEIVKYEPIVPASMSGQASGEYINYTMRYDFDSIQKHMNMFDDGEEVFVTEKLHGTLIEIAILPNMNDSNLFEGNIFVTSKGLAKNGFIYKNLPVNDDNLYVKILKEYIQGETLELLQWSVTTSNTPLYLFGEVFGTGVQDLNYGFAKPTLRLFDIAINREFLKSDLFFQFSSTIGLETVPLLYHGPFDRILIESFRDGDDTLNGKNIREGIVIKSNTSHPRFGRKVAKWVSPAYLLRKGNVTEFE